jgi:hypothetical protein
MQLNEYRDQLMGCWMGKNIGSTLGLPIEAKRGVFEIQFYEQGQSQDPAGNDDLDIQLIHLNALEKYGRNLNAEIIAEYWLNYVVADWDVFGIAKAHLRMGLPPPLSGLLHNFEKDCVSGMIMTELWACVAPGHPDVATRFAYEDTIKLHGVNTEGLYAALFTAALESAAFAVKDIDKLMAIGLSYVPERCRVSRIVHAIQECRRAGASWQDARQKVLDLAYSECVAGQPDFPRVKPWIGPMNLGFVVIGLLYGEGDFGKSVCTTVNCGEDTDSTGSITGAIMGILHGYRAIPQKWIEPLGDKIETITINRTNFKTMSIPTTITELTERVIKLTPQILGSEICDYVTAEKGYTIAMRDEAGLYRGPEERALFDETGTAFPDEAVCYPVRHEFPLFRTELQYLGDPFVLPGARKRFRLILSNNTRHQQWLSVTVHAPAGFTVSPTARMNAFLDYAADVMTNAQRSGKAAVEFEVVAEAEMPDRHRYDFFVDIVSQGHVSRGIVPIVLLAGGSQTLYHDVLAQRQA